MTDERFSEYYLKHSHQLVRFIVSRGGGDEAEDLAGTVWLRAWRFRAAFRGEARFSSWLCSIAVNVIRDHLRRMSVPARKAHVVELTPILMDRIPSMENLESQIGSKLELHGFTKDMVPDTLELFKLVFVFGFEYHEIADANGIAVSTLKSRIRRMQGKH